MRGSKFYGKGNQSPVKNLGIYKGSGEDRVRIGSKEAAELEAEGETVTRTAANNPNKEEGAQQTKNLGKVYSSIDNDMQERAEMKDENLKGGNPMAIENKEKPTQGTSVKKGNVTTTTMTGKEYREYMKNLKNKK
mgnify:CR=1 FL=1